jgi:O-antigen/teichoic acid export membrane protein
VKRGIILSQTIDKSRVISSLVWKFIERSSVQGIQFIVQIVLARLLLPKDYGVIALITIFIALANAVVQGGFSTALMQKKKVDEIDFSSVFYLGIIVASILYAVFFFSAPSIASFYRNPMITPVLRVLPLTLFFGAFSSVQTAIVSRKMQFKLFFISSLTGSLVAGFVGIIMAYFGYGAWALVAQQLIYGLLIVIVLSFLIKWRPSLIFSFKKIKELFSFGWKLLLSNVLDTLYNNIYALIIGRLFKVDVLGYYNRGSQFPSFISSNIDGTIQSVMFPTLAAVQEDKKMVKKIIKRTISVSTFFVFPTMVGLAVSAEPIIRLLLTDKWLPAVPFLQMMCFVFLFLPIHTTNLQAINALGRSDIFLRLEIIKKIIGVSVLAMTIPFGIYVMISSQIVVSLIATVINAFPNKRLFEYSFIEQAKDVAPSFILSLVVGGLIYTTNFVAINNSLKIVVQLLLWVVLYFGGAWLFKVDSFNFILENFRNIRNKTV